MLKLSLHQELVCTSDTTQSENALGLPKCSSGKESACQCRRHKRRRFDPWVRKILWSKKWQPTSVFLPGKFHGQRSLVGYSPWGCNKLDMTEQLSTQAHMPFYGLLRWLSGKESACQCRRHRLNPCVGKIPQRRKWQPTPVSVPEKFHGQKSLAGYSPWGHKELDTTE